MTFQVLTVVVMKDTLKSAHLYGQLDDVLEDFLRLLFVQLGTGLDGAFHHLVKAVEQRRCGFVDQEGSACARARESAQDLLLRAQAQVAGATPASWRRLDSTSCS